MQRHLGYLLKEQNLRTFDVPAKQLIKKAPTIMIEALYQLITNTEFSGYFIMATFI